MITSDIHTNRANELIADFDQLDSQSVAVEFVGTSITSSVLESDQPRLRRVNQTPRAVSSIHPDWFASNRSPDSSRSMSESSARPDFWNHRYASAQTPWDFGGVPAALTRYLAAHPGQGCRALVPGCGSGYEVVALADAGYLVTAIDFSPPAVARARANVGAGLAECVIEGDFFTHDFADAPFDFIYERTFLCALPPELWPKMVARMASLLRPGGTLAGLYFFGEKNDGPPFGLAADEPARLFDAQFVTVADQPVPAKESLPLFAGRERWQERRRSLTRPP